MSQVASPGPARTGPHGGTRQRRELNRAIRQSMRDLAVQLSLLTHQIGGRLDLKGTDLDCLDLIDRYGPIGPGALARRTGLHPATMTGIIDRLERGGWITRERDPNDRRAITVQLVRTRGREILRLFGGMNTAMTQICAGYTDDELAVIADFVRRTAEAATEAAAELPPA
jgi:DNA-binding MarR family transcriptional regulator